MPCSPSQIVPRSRAVAARERIRTRLVALLSRLDGAGAAHHVVTERSDDALATRLMDAFRVTRDPDVFEGLIEWVRPQLRGRVRARLRRLGAKLDAEEVWQDTIVNIYRYPDRFLANRAGAFAAWSSTIADNVIRRMLRQSRRDVSVCALDPELLQRQQDWGSDLLQCNVRQDPVAQPGSHRRARLLRHPRILRLRALQLPQRLLSSSCQRLRVLRHSSFSHRIGCLQRLPVLLPQLIHLSFVLTPPLRVARVKFLVRLLQHC